jgi:hypothetical protein
MQMGQLINRRQLQRKNCYFPLINDNGPVGFITNLSLGGLLVEAEAVLDPIRNVKGKLQLPSLDEVAEFAGEVVWTKPGGNSTRLYAGLRFSELLRGTYKSLQDYIAISRVNDLLKKFQKDFLPTEKNLKPIGDSSQIQKLLSTAQSDRTVLKIFWCKQYLLISTFISRLDSNQLLLQITDIIKHGTISAFDHLFIEFSSGNINYFFEAVVKNTVDGGLSITRPDTMFFGERRVESRRYFEEKENVFATVVLPNQNEVTVEVIDINISGLSFKISNPAKPETKLKRI